jgi:hypothetical protein
MAPPTRGEGAKILGVAGGAMTLAGAGIGVIIGGVITGGDAEHSIKVLWATSRALRATSRLIRACSAVRGTAEADIFGMVSKLGVTGIMRITLF